MKCIQTRLTEKQFIDRFDLYCRTKQHLCVGYLDRELFVYKMKNNRFWLCKYTPFIKNYRYTLDRLDCEYKIDEKGHVVVEYKYGKQPPQLVADIITLVLSLPLSIGMIVNSIINGDLQIEGQIIPLLFLVLSLKGLFFRSKKELLAQEECLKNICNIN